ncbi:MAG: hypothetical protein DSZ31_02850, partial [Gammaproteobacteria bacterium]
MGLKKLLPLLGLALFGTSLGGFSEEIITLKWKRYVGEKNLTITNQPLIYRDKILHATKGDEGGKDKYDKLYVFDKDGNLLWSFSPPDGGDTDLNGVVACDEFIAVTSDGGFVYAISWEGKILWKR